MKLNKKLVLQAFIQKSELELAAQMGSAKAAHAAATHEESKAEDRHDTFAIEQSYLAAGQAFRLAEIRRAIQEYQSYLELGRLDKIRPGALVTFKLDGVLSHALYANAGGGTRVSVSLGGTEISVQVLSQKSPIGDAMMDAVVGDEIAFENRGAEKIYQVIEIT